MPIEIHSSAVDAEFAAMRIDLSQLLCHTDRVSKVVILSDSRAALQAISSIEAPIPVDNLKCQLLIGDLFQSHIDIAIKRIPLHCGMDENENADCLAKKGTKIIQTFNNRVLLYSAKRIIKKYPSNQNSTKRIIKMRDLTNFLILDIALWS
ncbi:hypothetical protein TNCV_569951 [Trichonephila clavipes]|nr:hypothetical protein TNCV_569951 [Trichonephila clavipes]